MQNRTNIWQHFKGGLYRVLFLAADAETKKSLIVYMSLTDGSLWVRPEDDWVKEVLWADGQVRPRFIMIE